MRKQNNPGSVPGQKYGPIAVWSSTRGMSRWMTYDLLKKGHLRAIKCGTRTLIDFEHGDAYMASLPALHEAAA